MKFVFYVLLSFCVFLPQALIAQDSLAPGTLDFIFHSGKSPEWIIGLIMLIIPFALYILFDKSATYNKDLLREGGEMGQARVEEIRIYFLFLGFIAPISEFFIEYYHLRAHSELLANIISGVCLIGLYFISKKNLFVRRHMYKFLVAFFLTFLFSTFFKMIYQPFEVLTFAEYLLLLFFSFYIFLSMRHYVVFVLIIGIFLVSNFFNPGVEIKTAVLVAVVTGIIVVLNQVKHLVFLNSQEKLLFTNAVVNNGKTLVISSDKNGKITFISENVKDILGYNTEELLGDGWWEKTIDANTEHENEKEKIMNLYMNEVVSTRLIKTKAGEYRWIQWHDKRFNENLIVGIGQDITELKKFELERLIRLEKIEKQSKIIHELTILPYSEKESMEDSINNILKQAALGINVERFSIWTFESNRIKCLSLYVKSSDTFERGQEFFQKDYPHYINTLFQGKRIVAADVFNHPDTKEFCEEYYPSKDIRSLINLPFYVDGNLKGKVCCEAIGESRDWDAEDLNFIKSIADLLSITIETQRRKDAESLVKESEVNFRQINETIEDVFWLYDIKNDKILYISPSCQNILGASQDYFYQSNDFWTKYVLGDDKKVINQAHERIRKDGFYEIEYRIIKGDELRWIKERSFCIKNEAGEIIKNSGICSDITEEKKLKEELKQLSLVAQKTTNGVLISDGDAKAIWANQGFLDLMEVEEDDLIGKRARDLFLPPDAAEIELLNSRNFYVEIEISTFKKTKKWIGIANTVITDELGNVVQQIEVINDITERILNKQQIESQSKILEEITKELEFQNSLKEKLIYSQSLKDLTMNALAFIYKQYENSQQIAMVFPDNSEKFFTGYSYKDGHLNREEYLATELVSYEKCKDGSIFIQDDLANYDHKSASDFKNLENGVVSYICMPVIFQSDFVGLFFLGFSTPFSLSERQVSSLKDTMQMISITINQINLQEILQNKNDDIMSSIFYAKYIQESILPDLKNFSKYISNVSLLYQPKDIVSGDFYWCKETEHYSFISIADCTGHGVPGAFLMLLGMNMLEQLIGIEQLHDPSEILKKLDRRMFETLNRSSSDGLIRDGMEIAICVYDKRRKKLTYSGAGLGVLYFHNGEENHIRGQRASIADFRTEPFPFENSEIDVSGDEFFYMATDGYQDQLGGDRYKRFSKNRLIRQLDEQKELTPTEQEKRLSEQIQQYMGSYQQIDDFTVIGFKINP